MSCRQAGIVLIEPMNKKRLATRSVLRDQDDVRTVGLDRRIDEMVIRSALALLVLMVALLARSVEAQEGPSTALPAPDWRIEAERAASAATAAPRAPISGISERYAGPEPFPFARPGGGYRIGSWTLAPYVALTTTYDDNVGSSEDDPESDIIILASASARLNSNLARHAFGLGGTVSRSWYTQGTRQDTFALDLNGNARLDLSRKAFVPTFFSFTRDRVDTADPENADLPADDIATTIGAGIGYSRALAVGRVRVDLNAQRRLFELTEDRDFWAVNLGTRYFRPVGPRATADAGLRYGWDTFDEAEARDSQEISVDTGVTYRLNDAISIRGGIGYTQFLFEDTARDNNGGFTFDLDLGLGQPIPLDPRTVLTLNAGRGIRPTEDDSFSLRTTTFFRASIVRRVGMRVSADVATDYRMDEFDDGSRRDHNIGLGGGVSYLLTDRASLRLGYDFDQRFSDAAGAAFRRNLVSLRLSLSL